MGGTFVTRGSPEDGADGQPCAPAPRALARPGLVAPVSGVPSPPLSRWYLLGRGHWESPSGCYAKVKGSSCFSRKCSLTASVSLSSLFSKLLEARVQTVPSGSSLASPGGPVSPLGTWPQARQRGESCVGGAGGMRQPNGRQTQVENGVPAQPRLEGRPWDPAPQARRQCSLPPAALYSERNYPSDPFPPRVQLGLPVPVLQAPAAGAVSCKWCPPTALLAWPSGPTSVKFSVMLMLFGVLGGIVAGGVEAIWQARGDKDLSQGVAAVGRVKLKQLV